MRTFPSCTLAFKKKKLVLSQTLFLFWVHVPLYLFLFCAEGLNAIIRGATLKGNIQGFSLCKRGPKITHLFFANDCLLFCRSTLAKCEKIQELLYYYEVASGQMINKNKTTLFFSKNTDVQI